MCKISVVANCPKGFSHFEAPRQKLSGTEQHSGLGQQLDTHPGTGPAEHGECWPWGDTRPRTGPVLCREGAQRAPGSALQCHVHEISFLSRSTEHHFWPWDCSPKPWMPDMGRWQWDCPCPCPWAPRRARLQHRELCLFRTRAHRCISPAQGTQPCQTPSSGLGAAPLPFLCPKELMSSALSLAEFCARLLPSSQKGTAATCAAWQEALLGENTAQKPPLQF